MKQLDIVSTKVKNPQTGQFESIFMGGVNSGGGTSDYSDLNNKPSINNVVLEGNKTLSQLGIAAQDTTYTKNETNDMLDDKVDKVSGKGLSTEDYTTAEKSKLSNIEAGAEVNVQSDWEQADSTADDFIKNKPSLLTLGESTSTAYAGNKGKQNADNIGTMSALTTTVKSSLVEAVNEVDQLVSLGAGLKVEGQTFVVDDVSYTAKNGAEIFNNYANNKAIGEYSHAEGFNTVALGSEAHAEGGTTKASGNWSHAEGAGTQATNDSAHSEGWGTKATGKYSHAEGHQSEATNDAAHAEGTTAKAQGNSSHAEGNGTLAGGFASHAEGNATKALGSQSHAAGSNTIALGNNQYVIGKFNWADNQNKYAFIIGNGEVGNTSNALSVDWNGLIYVNGSEAGVDVSALAPQATTYTKEQVDEALAAKLNTADVDTALSSTSTNPVQNKAVRAPIARLVDSGAKNIASVGAAPNRSDLNIQVVNGHVSISGTLTSAFTWNVVTFDNYVCKTDMIIPGASTSANIVYSCYYTDETGTARYTTIPNNSILTIPARSTIHYLYIQQRTSGMSVSIEVDVMLCTAEDYAISPEFVPYTPSNRELYEVLKQNDLTSPSISSSATLAAYADNLGKGYHTGFFTSLSKPSDAPVSDNCFIEIFVYSANTAYIRVTPTGTAYVNSIYVRTKVSGAWQRWYKFEGTAVT